MLGAVGRLCARSDIRHPAKDAMNMTAKPHLAQAQELVVSKLSEISKLPPRQIAADVDFADFGLDSVSGVELTTELSTLIGVELDPLVLFQHPTLHSLMDYLQEV